MIPTLQSSDKELGGQAAEAIRNQLQKQTNVRELVVVPKADIVNSLTSSGYNPTEALAPGDAKALATLVRAPQYLDGVVTKTPTGFKIDSRLIIARDMNRGQVLPSAQAAKLDNAASQVAKSIKAARQASLPEKRPATMRSHRASTRRAWRPHGRRWPAIRTPISPVRASWTRMPVSRWTIPSSRSPSAYARAIHGNNDRAEKAALKHIETAGNDTTNELRGSGRSWLPQTRRTSSMVQDVVAYFGQDRTRPGSAVPLVETWYRAIRVIPSFSSSHGSVYLNAKDSRTHSCRQRDWFAWTRLQRLRITMPVSRVPTRRSGQKQQASEAAARGFSEVPW